MVLGLFKNPKKALLVNSTPKVGQRKPTAVKHLNVLNAPCFEQVNHSSCTRYVSFGKS